MKSESYRVLARHFSESAAARVEFKPGACPQTDGRTITLPTEINDRGALQLLGALLHETAHIKHSGIPAEVNADLAQGEAICLNALEDIRIEHLTAQKYPKAPEFIQALLDDAMARNREKLIAEPGAMQILKGLYMTAAGRNPADLYTDKKILEIIAEFRDYIDRAKSCSNIIEVKALARALALAILGKQPAIPPPAEVGYNGPGQPGGSQIPGDLGIRDGSGGFTGHAQQEAEAAQNKAQEAQAAADKAKDQAKAAGAAQNEAYKKARDLDKSSSAQSGVATRYRRESRSAERAGDLAQAQALRDKAAGKEALAQELHQARNKAAQAANDLYHEAHKAQEIKEAAQAVADEEKKIAMAAENQFRGLSTGEQISGFGAVDATALEPENSAVYAEVPLPDIIADALLHKDQEAHQDETGAKLNNARLPEIYTAADRLFITREPAKYTTKVAFIVDVSGSMGSMSRTLDSGSSMDLAIDAVLHLSDAFHAAIEAGAPGDFAVYLFGTKVIRVIASAESYSRKRAAEIIGRRRYEAGDNTRLLMAANKAAEDLKAEADFCSAVIITDAQVDESELKSLANGLSGDIKTVWVSANRQEDAPALVNELFGDCDIRSQGEARKVLAKALLKSI